MFDLRHLAEIAAGPWPAAICTVTSTKGSTPRKAGASMVVIADGSPLGAIEGTVGGGAVEHALRRAALDVAASSQPRAVEIALSQELGMCCGGTMTFFIEPLRARPPLVLFGAGHVAQALCRVASTAGFDVTVADPRDELLSTARFPDAVMLVNDYERDDMVRMPFGADAFVVIATHDHQMDQAIVERVLAQPFRWAGLVGSQRKALLTRQRCLNKGLSERDVQRLRCPVGVDIGAETPEEIAISVVAEMVSVRRAGDADARRTRGTAIALVGLPPASSPGGDASSSPGAPLGAHGQRGGGQGG